MEAIFSNVQPMILDNSDDAEARVTQRRISAHLWSRNHRRDRRIRIPYLADCHKH